MWRSSFWFCAALILAAPAGVAAQSARVSLEIEGITGELRDNVEALLSLSQAPKQ